MTRWALVPAIQDDDMDLAYRETWYAKKRCIDDADSQDAYAAMIAASPGNALLSEILAERDYVTANTDPAKRCNDLRLILDALAKLGPAL